MELLESIAWIAVGFAPTFLTLYVRYYRPKRKVSGMVGLVPKEE